MKYSLVIPLYNEVNFLDNLFNCIENFEIKPEQIICIDGGSTDGTVDLLIKYQSKNRKIIVANNSLKFVPNALNIGIELNTSPIIIRLDAHSSYKSNYTSYILEIFATMPEVDIVGGPMRMSDNLSPFQRAIGMVTAYPFVIGPSTFHDVNYSGFTETVYLGAYRTELFKKVGLFDLDLNRNQDDEFHFRACKSGVLIFQDARIFSLYFPRKNTHSLYKQYFEYGLFKPIVYKKNNKIFRIRHLVPSFLVIYLILLPFLLFVSVYTVIPFVLYVILLIYSYFLTLNLWSIVVIPIIHFAYGFGFLAGLKKYFN